VVPGQLDGQVCKALFLEGLLAVEDGPGVPKVANVAILALDKARDAAGPTGAVVDTRCPESFLSGLEANLQQLRDLTVGVHLFNLLGFAF